MLATFCRPSAEREEQAICSTRLSAWPGDGVAAAMADSCGPSRAAVAAAAAAAAAADGGGGSGGGGGGSSSRQNLRGMTARAGQQAASAALAANDDAVALADSSSTDTDVEELLRVARKAGSVNLRQACPYQ